VAAVPGVATAAPMIRMSASTSTGQVLLFGADKNSAELGGALKDAVAQPVEQLDVEWGLLREDPRQSLGDERLKRGRHDRPNR